MKDDFKNKVETVDIKITCIENNTLTKMSKRLASLEIGETSDVLNNKIENLKKDMNRRLENIEKFNVEQNCDNFTSSVNNLFEKNFNLQN